MKRDIKFMEYYQHMALEDRIQQTIDGAMCTQYIGGFTLEIEDDTLWTLRLNLNQSEAPLSLSYEGDEDGFFRFLEKELRSRQLDRVKYYSGEQTTPGVDNHYIIYEYGNR
jgi:hypothetical protein